MNFTLRTPLLLGAYFLFSTLCAQISQPGTPYHWNDKSISQADIPVVTTAELDMAKITAEDEVTDRYKEAPYRFGIEQEVDIDLLSAGHLTEFDKGDKMWQFGIHCPNATSVNLNFSEWHIPVGGRVTVWSQDRTEYLGSYTSANNKDYKTFAIGLIHSDKIVIEYHQEANVTDLAAIRIGTIVHGYRMVLDKSAKAGPFGNSGSCNMNVNCPDGANWQEEKRGVALILSGGFTHCTGSLVNNTAQNGAAYFLTASHCDGNENNWVFYFNHETVSCSGSSGPTNQTISGATELVSGASSDYHLIELSSPVPPSFNPYYNGWDNSNSAVSSAVGIHHPDGDVKKISFDDDPLQKTNYSSSTTSSNGTHWRIETWERNTTTEGGSSGSPLFDQNHRIIGQLHGGGAACGNSLSDWYGAISNSWSGLSTYLDPGNTGVSTLDGSAGGPVPTCSDGIQNQGETDIDCGGPCAPCPCLDGESTTITIVLDDYPQETSWTLTSNGTTVATSESYADEADGSTVSQTLCLAVGCYDFTITDSFGDGICCAFGSGSYDVSGEGVSHASGGEFTSEETTSFCIEAEVTTCDGDLNGDLIVNVLDFINFNGQFGVPCSGCAADFDGNGTVDVGDFLLFNSFYGNNCNANPAQGE